MAWIQMYLTRSNFYFMHRHYGFMTENPHGGTLEAPILEWCCWVLAMLHETTCLGTWCGPGAARRWLGRRYNRTGAVFSAGVAATWALEAGFRTPLCNWKLCPAMEGSTFFLEFPFPLCCPPLPLHPLATTEARGKPTSGRTNKESLGLSLPTLLGQ